LAAFAHLQRKSHHWILWVVIATFWVIVSKC
jgi:hypothetical protein